MTINLEEQPQQSVIDLGDDTSPTVSPNVATTRATKAVFGTNVPYEDVYSSIMAGREPQIRERVAAEQQAKNAQDIASFISTRQTPLTRDEVNEKFNRPVDPASVFEDNYAKQYVSYLYQIPGHEIVDDNGMWHDAVNIMPDQVKATTEFTRDLVTKREVLNRRLEDAKAAYAQQGYLGFGVDIAKTLFQPYAEYQLRGNIPGAEFGLGLGTALENQRFAYWRGLNSQVVPAFNAAMDHLIKVDPLEAVHFATAMQALSDKDMDNLYSLGVPFDALGLAKAGMKLAMIPKAIALNKEIQAAAKSMAKSAPNAESTTVRRAAADAVGDNAVAGQRGFVDEILAGNQDPWSFGFGGKQQTLPGTTRMEDTIKEVQSVFKSDMDKALARPGNNGAEVMNRLRESYQNTMDAVINAITNVARVQRIGTVLASELVTKGLWQEARQNYKNIANSIIQINPPEWDVLTGGHTVDYILGRSDGTFFASKEEALAWAKVNNIPITYVEPTKGKSIFREHLSTDEDKRLRRTLTADLNPTVEYRETTYTNAQGEKVKARVAVSKNVPKEPEEFPKTGGYLRSAEIGAQGKKYYIALNKPVRETSDLIRDGLMETEASKKSNKGFLNSLGLPAWIRTPGEVLSEQEMANRITAIYTPAVMKQVIANAMTEMTKAKKFTNSSDAFSRIKGLFGAKSDFDRFLEFGQKKVDPATGKPGYTWTNPQDMAEEFQQTIGRVPHPIEVEGYFAAQRGMAMDWAFRNLALYRNMQRVGAETHTILMAGAKSNPLAAVQLKELPKDGYNVLLMDEQGMRPGKSQQFENSVRGRAATEKVKSGEYVVLDMYNRDLRPLQGFNGIKDENYRYVVLPAKNVETRPLDFIQLPRTGGTHFVYDASHYIKQAKISGDNLLRGERGRKYFTRRYEGDNTLMPIDNRLMGNDIVNKLENVRMALQDNDLNAAKLHARDLPIPWEDLHGWFNEKRGPGGVVIPPRLDKDEPFYVVPKDKMVIDIQNHFNNYTTGINLGNKFEDGTKEGSLARQFQVEFTGERDAQEVFTIANQGTRANPLYDYRPAEMIDPTTVMNRALSRVVDSIWMDDYKISSMEHWMQEAIKLNAFKESDRELRGAPWWYFMNGKLKSGLPVETANLLEAKRWMIKNFNGVPSTIDAWSHGVQQTLADAVYGGSNAVIRTGALLGKYALAATTNAPSFLRSVAYRMDIGLFSIPQLIVQSQNYVSIYGIAGPIRAAQGTVGALLHQYSRINSHPNILQKLDDIAQKFGWKPGQWLDAREALQRTGFEYVSKETNVLMSHYHMQPNFFKSSWGTMLDVGEMPFKGGERFARHGAWYSTYAEKGLVGKASNTELTQMLNRASTMAGDMTRASKSALQMGPLSFPTQFLGYTLRLSEQFTGKRLSRIEKARLFGAYALAYGVPVSSSAALLGLPINEAVKKAALDYGYVDGENQISNSVMNGLPAAIMQMVTSEDWSGKGGKRYNVPERLGPGNYDLYRDVLAGDKPFWSVMAGPTGALATNAAEAMDPFMSWTMDHLRGTAQSKLTLDHLVGVLKQSAAGANMVRLSHALATGDWASRNENVIERGVSPMNALWMTGTGLQPMSATDARVIKSAEEDQKTRDQDTGVQFKKEFLRGMQAVNNQDFDQADTYFNNAFARLVTGNFPKEKEAELIANTLSPDTWPDKVKWAYYLGREVPSGKTMFGGEDIRQIRQRAYSRILQQQGKQ